NKQDELLLKAYAKIIKAIKHSNTFKNDCLKEYEELNELYLSLANLISSKKNNQSLNSNSNLNDINEEEINQMLNVLIQRIDKIKTKIENLKNLNFFYDILQATLIQFELNLARIYVLKAKTKEDSFNKSLIWIKEHLEWLKMIYA
ncbi:DUF115 domain-containing protein, partial [Campylobacter novaezeelandiae]